MTYVNRSSGSIVVTPDQESNKAAFYIPGGGTDGQVLARHGSAERVVKWKSLDKTSLGLDQVDNTPDNLKPVSEAVSILIGNRLPRVSPHAISSLRLTPGGDNAGYGAFWDFDGSNLQLRFTAQNDAAGGLAMTALQVDAGTGKWVIPHDVEIQGLLTLPNGNSLGDVKLDETNLFTKRQAINHTRANASVPAASLSLRAGDSSNAETLVSIHFGPHGTDLTPSKNIQWGYNPATALLGGYDYSGEFVWGVNSDFTHTHFPNTVRLGVPRSQGVAYGIPSLEVGVHSAGQNASVLVHGGDALDMPFVGVQGPEANIGLRLKAKGTGKVLLGDSGEEVVGSGSSQTLTNKTIPWANNTFSLSSAQLFASLSDKAGTGGDVVFSTAPTFNSPFTNTPASNDNSTRIPNTGWVRSQNYLTANQTITFTGDATGSGATSVSLTLANSGVTAGWYARVNVDAKGRVVGGGALSASDIPNLTASKITDLNTAVRLNRLDQLAVPTANIDLNQNRLVNLADAVNPQDAVNKRFVESLIQGLDPKGLVVAATTANITLSGTQTVDGVALAVGNRVLVRLQTNAAQNGIYIVSAGTWTRSPDADTWYELSMGYTIVGGGTTFKGNGFYFRVGETGVLETDPLIVDQFSTATEVLAGNGLVKNGNEFAIGQGVGISVTADEISLAGQALALHNFTGNGFLVRTGPASFTTRIVAAVGSGISATNESGISGDVSISLSSSLQALGYVNGGVNKIAYYVSSSVAAMTNLSVYSRTNLFDLVDQAALQAVVGNVPVSGTVGQVLMKSGVGNYASAWTSLTTENVGEHSSKLYYTDARVRSAVLSDTEGTNNTTSAPTSRLFKAVTDQLRLDIGSGGGGSFDPDVSYSFSVTQKFQKDRPFGGEDSYASNAQLVVGTTDTNEANAFVTIGFAPNEVAALSSNYQFGVNYAISAFGWFDGTGVPIQVTSLDRTRTYSFGESQLGINIDKALGVDSPTFEVKPLGLRAGNQSWMSVTAGDLFVSPVLSAESIHDDADLVLKSKGLGQVMLAGSAGFVVGTAKAQTLTNKSINFANNSVYMTSDQLRDALNDFDYYTGSGKVVFSSNAYLTSPRATDHPESNSEDGRLATTFWVKSQLSTVYNSLSFAGDVFGSIFAGTATLTLPNIVSGGWASRIQYNDKGQVIGAAQLAEEDIPALGASKISNFNTAVRTNRLDQLAIPTAALNFNAQLLTNIADPVNDTDATNKRYVQGLLEGLDSKSMVRAASTIDHVFLSGELSVDGILVVNGDRVLIKNQSNPAKNGIYVVNGSGNWVRASDANTWYELSKAYTIVADGTVNKGRGYFFNVGETGTLESDALTVDIFSSATSNSFGNGLQVDGNAVSVKAHTGIAVTANGVALTGQALALHNVSTNGWLMRAGGNIVVRQLTTFGTGIAMINETGESANPIISLTNPLQALGNTTAAANKLPYYTSASAAAMTDFTAYSRTVLALSNKAAYQAEIGVVPTGGTAGQALLKVDSTNYNGAWTSLNTTHVAEDPTKLYYTDARVRTAVLVDNLSAQATDKAPTQNAVWNAVNTLTQNLDSVSQTAGAAIGNDGLPLASGYDLNTIVKSGFYSLAAAPTNGPSGDLSAGSNLTSMSGAGGNQKFTQMLVVNATGKIFVRTGARANTTDAVTWNAWAEVGAGGGATIPSVEITASAAYTLSATDVAKELIMNRATASTVVVPLDSVWAAPVDTVIQVTQGGVGVISIAKGNASVVFQGKGGLKADGQYTSIFLKKRAAANTWLIQGGVE